MSPDNGQPMAYTCTCTYIIRIMSWRTPHELLSKITAKIDDKFKPVLQQNFTQKIERAMPALCTF